MKFFYFSFSFMYTHIFSTVYPLNVLSYCWIVFIWQMLTSIGILQVAKRVQRCCNKKIYANTKKRAYWENIFINLTTQVHSLNTVVCGNNKEPYDHYIKIKTPLRSLTTPLIYTATTGFIIFCDPPKYFHCCLQFLQHVSVFACVVKLMKILFFRNLLGFFYLHVVS